MNRPLALLVIAPLGWLTVACSDAASQQPAGDRPLGHLPPGQHVGMIIGFEAYDPPLRQAVDRTWNRAPEAGMRIGRIQLDWRDLEPRPGHYDRRALADALAEMNRDGLAAFVSICAIDSEGPVMPADLMDPDTPTELINGLPLDDPRILRRYRSLLDWAVPLIVAHGGWVLSISNEPEGYLEDHPRQVRHVLSFFGESIRHVHARSDRLPVTVTLTAAPIDRKKPFHDELMRMLDVAAYNYYPLRIDENQRFTLRRPLADHVPRNVAALVAASRGKPIVFQELGCPADETLGSSAARQAAFFRLFFTEMERTPQIRAAYVFQMVDWSGPLSRRFTDTLRREGLPDLAESMDAWLTTVGLISHPRAETRPARDVVLQAIESCRVRPETRP